MAVALANRTRATTCLWTNTLDRWSLANHCLLDDQKFGPDIVVVLGIGNGALKGLGDQWSCLLGNEAELLEGINGWQALNLTGNLTGLEGGDARVAVGGDNLHG